MKEMRFGLVSSGLFLEVSWYPVTNISGRSIVPIFQNQATHVSGTSKMYRNARTNKFYRNVDKNY
jgi:hypothetical protein